MTVHYFRLYETTGKRWSRHAFRGWQTASRSLATAKTYVEAVEESFGADVDYAQLVKIYGAAPEGQRRYSPAICTEAVKHKVEGNPDPKHVSTSFVERQNLISVWATGA